MKFAIFIAPIVVAWFTVRLAASSLWRPDGLLGAVAWILQAAALASVVSIAVERVARRALPLAALLNLSLVFPDVAPSRFATALRSGTVRQLEKRLDDVRQIGLGDNAADAAQTAIELVTLLGHHDPQTRGHTERVRAYADLIAAELGMNERDRNRLMWGVMLHDIGKLTVPSEILSKKTALTDDEWAVLQRHPIIGQQMLKPLMGFLGDFGWAAGDHHERWDGGGYPRGIKGEYISLAGRITAVADSYDVITSKRSYKQAMSPQAARAELVRCSGKQFDPAIVRAFLNVSLGSQHWAGRFAWITEIPGLAVVANSASAAPTAIAGGLLVAASASPTIPAPDLDLAFGAPSTTIEAAPVPTETGQTETAPTETELTGTAQTETTSIGGPSDDTVPGGLAGDEPSRTATTTETPTSSTTAPASTSTGVAPATTTTPVTAPTDETTTTSSTTIAPPVIGPMAFDDSYTIATGSGTSRLQVTANDVIGNLNIFVPSLEIVDEPTVIETFSARGNQIRVDAPSTPTTDTLTYQVCDREGRCDTAVVTITFVD